MNSSATAWSLRGRLLTASIIVVAFFIILTGIALDRAFGRSVIALNQERLQARIYMLIGAAEMDNISTLKMPTTLPESELSNPGSGAYAAISSIDAGLLWQSESSLAMNITYPDAGTPGVPVAGDWPNATGQLLTLSYPVIWELAPGVETTLIFSVAQDRVGMNAEVTAFRNTLLAWLGGAGLLLLLLQVTVLIWSMAPVRRVADEVRQIQAGEKEHLSDGYPQELRPLTDNLNEFINSRQVRLRRYRESLADLAHSLKTPLAILRTGAASESAHAQKQDIQAQIEIMDKTIEYQLQRAATSGRSPLGAAIDVNETAMRVLLSLQKLYQEKQLELDVNIAPGTKFMGDPGDLAEMLGNLGDNACKWAESRVRIQASNKHGSPAHKTLALVVEDDGPGIPRDLRNDVLKRGVRTDSRTPGQGIGLAVVREMVEDVYKGSLEIDRGELGGTRIQIMV